ncbi:serine hydrolase [Altererythrobacter luteolus]|uniref:Serine hydrolase n=1 Tax=Pontixanthobacter luteolus TaxID=295089 RepID=A0A6I4V1E3_9SPHN|nr:serine hydrolase [Pontixanthobacter luteolus]MXP46660.1 serine hydrolase [Pontixanthobacter luteolus]
MRQLFALFSLWFTAVAFPAAAQDLEAPLVEERATEALSVLQGDALAENIFDPAFLQDVSAEQLIELGERLESEFGKPVVVESINPTSAYSGGLTVRFERGMGIGHIALSPADPHRITGLQFTSFHPLNDNIEKIEAELEALPGEIAVLFTPLADTGAPIFSLNPDAQMAIGSTFKLYVLSALARSINTDERNWNDVVVVDRKSFPSGQLQAWPDGTPMTLQTLATMMITISDNTATDMLFHELGRRKIEAEMEIVGHSDPARNKPFLSTLELFALKGSEGNLRKYIAANEAAKRRILDDFQDDVGGDPAKVEPPRFVQPTAIGTVEWFASASDLKQLAVRLAQIEDPTARKILSVNPSLPAELTQSWSYAGYKGGSEPGVLNLTWLLRDKAGQWHMLTMGWNDPNQPLENARLELLAQRLLRLAR